MGKFWGTFSGLGQSLIPGTVFYILLCCLQVVQVSEGTCHQPGLKSGYPHHPRTALWSPLLQAVQGRMPLQSHYQCPRLVKCILLAILPLQNFPPYRNSLSPTFPRQWCKGNLYKSACSGIELRPTGRSNVSKVTGP